MTLACAESPTRASKQLLWLLLLFDKEAVSVEACSATVFSVSSLHSSSLPVCLLREAWDVRGNSSAPCGETVVMYWVVRCIAF